MKIVITGTSSGIGEGLADFYCRRGYEVTGISRRGNAKLRKYENYDDNLLDLTDFDQSDGFFCEYFTNNKNIDLVILNSGILGRIDRFENQGILEIKELMNINVWANKIIIDLILRTKAKVKRVAAISSGAAKNGSAGWGPYSVSKAALNMLIKTYAAENPEIHFSAIAPGLVDTKMQEYISSLDTGDEFPAIARLQKARGTEAMPDPYKAAALLDRAFEKAVEFESGIFLDVREL